MDDRQLSLYLSRILSGYYIFIYDAKTYTLKYPSIDIKYQADLIADEEFDSLKYSGWFTKDSILYHLYDLGIWDQEKDVLLKQNESQIENYKVDLFKNHLNPQKTKNTRRSLQNVRKRYNDLYVRRHSFDHITIEGYCDQIKNEFLLVNSIYHDGNLCFKDYNNHMLFREINFHISKNTIDVSVFKKIARSDIWRNYWSANKDNIFGKSVVDWTDEQKTLVVLTRMYDNARESTECPPDIVFDDDDMFDGWMISQRREAEKEKSKKQVEKNLSGKLGKAGEIFLAASSREEADSIYGMNDDTTKAIVQERQAFLRDKQEVNAADLPDVQRDILTQYNDMRKQRSK